jgi:hypothetical protein
LDLNYYDVDYRLLDPPALTIADKTHKPRFNALQTLTATQRTFADQIAHDMSHYFHRRSSWMYHEDRTSNEFNLAAGVEYATNRPWHISGEFYHNSIRRNSIALSAGMEFKNPVLPSSGNKAGLEAGFVTGYHRIILPSVTPYLRLGNGINVKLDLIPPLPCHHCATGLVQLRVSIGSQALR